MSLLGQISTRQKMLNLLQKKVINPQARAPQRNQAGTGLNANHTPKATLTTPAIRNAYTRLR